MVVTVAGLPFSRSSGARDLMVGSVGGHGRCIGASVAMPVVALVVVVMVVVEMVVVGQSSAGAEW
jgi:hypothetical protein